MAVPTRVLLLLALAAALALVLMGGGVAFAHAELVRSDPPENAVLSSLPAELRLWFSEAPEPSLSRVELLDASGHQVQALGRLQADPSDPTLLRAPLSALPNGVYTVAWRTTSADDGHINSGFFAFVLGLDQLPSGGIKPAKAGATVLGASGPTPIDAALRWLGYLGMSLLAGGFAFYLLALRPSAAGLRLASGASPSRGPEVEGENPGEVSQGWEAFPVNSLRILVAIGWVVTLIATFVGAVEEAANGGGVSFLEAIGPPLGALLGGTSFGAFVWLRLSLLMVLAMVLLYAPGDLTRRGGTAGGWFGLALTLPVLLVESYQSHAASETLLPLSVVADWIHLAAASIWMGGLIAMLVVLPPLVRWHGEAAAVPVAKLTARFSLLATWCVLALGLTGPYRALGEIDNVGELFGTPYGTTLLIKLGLLIPLLGLALLNRALILRRLALATAAISPAQASSPWIDRLGKTVGGEVILVSAVLVATSFLAAQAPPLQTYGSGLVLRGETKAVQAVLIISPGRPGANSFDVYLRGTSGQLITDAEQVTLLFSANGQDLGETQAAAKNVGDGQYRVEGNYLSLVDTWHIELLVRQPHQGENSRIDFTVQALQLAIDSGGGHSHH